MKRHFSPLAVLLLAAAAFSQLLHAADWPQWRGADRTDVSKETGLLKQWPSQGPKKVWMFDKGGNGYSGFSVVNGWLFTMGTRDGKEILLALNANTGKEIWATPVADILGNGWGDGPRGTPTIDADHVYALSGRGTLVCASVRDGKILWQKSMAELGGKTPGWGYTESPLVDGKIVACTPGGSQGAVAALDKMTGAVVWQSSEFTDGAQYASLVPADINGAHQLVQLTKTSVAGVSAKDGKLLWRADFPGERAAAVIPTPIVKGNAVYVTSGYGVGCMELKIGPNNAVEKVFENKNMVNHHGGVILVGDHLYGFSDAHGWICQSFATGDEVWSSRNLRKGAVGCADGMLYCLEEESGAVALVEASPKGWAEHGRFKLDPQTTIRSAKGRIWTHPVISNGKLYLRDQDLIFCYDVKGS
jgi:outer membrane protein assembly factor BamB